MTRITAQARAARIAAITEELERLRAEEAAEPPLTPRLDAIMADHLGPQFGGFPRGVKGDHVCTPTARWEFTGRVWVDVLSPARRKPRKKPGERPDGDRPWWKWTHVVEQPAIEGRANYVPHAAQAKAFAAWRASLEAFDDCDCR